MKLIEEQPIV